MKLILIEDEPDSLLGMKTAVETIDMEFTLLTSNHGEEALALIREERPDLIVTDIMLPGMTGLDLAERVRDGEYQPKVIIVSGYNEFEYARRSIRIGVADYLLKPYSTEEFITKVHKSMSMIVEENEQLRSMKQQRTFAEIGNRSMRDEYLIDFCLKKAVLEEHIYQRLCLWDIEWLANQSYTLFVMDAKGYPDGKPVAREFALQTFAIGNIVQELIRARTRTILFKDPKNRWVLITGTDETEQLSGMIAEHIEKYQKFPFSIGMSTRKSAFEHLHSAYQEALTAFRIQSLSTALEYWTDDRTADLNPEDTVSPDKMSAWICVQEDRMIEQGVRDFIRKTVLLDGKSREDVVRQMLNYLSEIHVHLSEVTSKELVEIPMKVWESFDACQTLEEYEIVLGDYLKNLAKDMAPQKTNAIIERAVQIIATRYMEDLSLQIIAAELSIHPVWLSQSFKKETGQTYMDFLTETRIEKAKALLRETSMKVYEIAESVGYQDLQHFGSQFKKRTGQTPKEYRYGK
ncbi:response regulator [Paenibacillus abyssi]|uniref:response regulator n=1 Tax=Paenibacillus abyssi TaxID=1340531 RepID=UPI00360D662E